MKHSFKALPARRPKSESSLHFVVMTLSPLVICKVGAGGLPSFSGSVVRVTTGAAGEFSMVAAEAGLAPGLAAKRRYWFTSSIRQSSQLAAASPVTLCVVSIVLR